MTVQVNVSANGGFDSAVTLSTGTLAAGLAAGFSPATLPAPGSGVSTLTISAGAGAAAGPYSLTLTATGGGVTQTLPLSVSIQPSCSYAINPSSAAPPAAGGTFTASVMATNGCTWTASSVVNWLTISAGASGTGNGIVTYAVAANTTTSSRTGSLTIAGLALTVTEAGAVPTVPVLNPASAAFTAAGGAGNTALTVPQVNKAWMATSNVKWIIITSPSVAKGNRTVTYWVAANMSGATRTGYLTIAGVSFPVTQAATSCSYGVTLGRMSAAPGGFNGTALVSTQAACPWTAVSNASWIMVTSGSPGIGPGTAGFFVANNPNPAARTEPCPWPDTRSR